MGSNHELDWPWDREEMEVVAVAVDNGSSHPDAHAPGIVGHRDQERSQDNRMTVGELEGRRAFDSSAHLPYCIHDMALEGREVGDIEKK